jgi:putative membrane protein
MLAATGPLHWQPHPEVCLLVLSVIGLGLSVTRVIQPKMVAAGEAPISRRQKGFFALGVLLLWLASDWPVHDVAEEHLYSVHMVQHLVLTYVMPPVFLFATPAWLVRLVLGKGAIGRFVQRLGRPLIAAIGFNAILALTHAAWVVNTSARVGPFHYVVHVALVLFAFLMWMPVCGPVPELRLTLPVQMGYIFLMSVLPTIPAAFLTVAENPLYRAYDGPFRMWGINVIQDQQAAGLIMKLGGGFYLWTIITVLFFKWSARHMAAERQQRTVTEREVLTFEEVQASFERAGDAPADVTPGVKPEAAS